MNKTYVNYKNHCLMQNMYNFKWPIGMVDFNYFFLILALFLVAIKLILAHI